MKNKMLSSVVGDKSFYKKVFLVAMPIVVQNTITNFVDMLDNIMIGRCGTDQMNGVSIVVQLMFVFHLCVWGFSCGAGIFTSQYFGKGDHDGVRSTFRAKIYITSILTLAAAVLFIFAGDFFMKLFIHESNSIGDPEATLFYGKKYLNIMLVGMIPFAVSMVYSNTLRNIGETALPMEAGIVAVVVNLFLNYVLIFGHFGFPALGVVGAGIATCASRFTEIFIIIVWTHTHTDKCEFIKGAYKSMRIPSSLMKNIIVKGIPLGANETLWSLGLTFLNQSYSLRGLYVIAALNITSTVTNLFNVVLFAIGESISIIVGQLLGAGKNTEAKKTATRMICLSSAVCLFIAVVMFFIKDLFPSIYKTEQEVKDLASCFILFTAVFLPVLACVHGCYFTLRCGGKTFITFLFDSVFVWVFLVPAAALLTRFTSFDIMLIYLIVKSLDLIKAVIGILLVKKGVWINNMVGEK